MLVLLARQTACWLICVPLTLTTIWGFEIIYSHFYDTSSSHIEQTQNYGQMKGEYDICW